MAALVDLSPPPVAEGEDPAAAKAKLTLADVEDIIRNATGAMTADAKAIKVVEVPFYVAAAVAGAGADSEGGGWEMYLEIARRGSLGVLVLGALLVLKMFGGSKKPKAEAGAPALEGQTGAATENLLTAGAGEIGTDALRNRISNALQDNPEAVRRLFLTWAQDEGSED